MSVATTPAPHASAILAALVVLALVTAIEPRTVPRGQWLVVLRSGRVHRVRTTGFTARVPLLEQYVWLPRAYTRRPFVVSARSSDGLEVRIDGEVGIRIVEPAVAVGNAVSPLDLALDETERALARAVAYRDVATIAELPPYVDLAIDVPGVEVGALTLGTIEVALRSVAHQAK
ncbi:SPFH domain-containing protein [Kribbella sp. NPDC003557]|uniref:SPFH domain-containing protein n=1 Tax=Kribbella sp. NPDC003557 TaxID=3154449 RepID=UPI00339DFCFC